MNPRPASSKTIFVDHNDKSLLRQIEILESNGIACTMAELSEPSEDDIIAACQGYDFLVSSRTRLTEKVLRALPQVKMVCVPQVGFDHVDVQTITDLGLKLGHSAYCNYTEVASHALGMALMLVRQISPLQDHTAQGDWDFTSAGPLQRPDELTVGIVGLGRIGQAFAERAAPCFNKIIAFDPFKPAENWPEHVGRIESLSDLLGQSDIVSLHTPLTDVTRNMVDADFLAKMPKGAYLVNTSRGEVADTGAIIAALDNQHLAGAALDVLPKEPPDHDDPILTHSKVVVTPHSAFFSEQSRSEKYAMATENILSFVETGAPKYDALL